MGFAPDKKRIAYNVLAPAYDVASDALTLGIHRLARRELCQQLRICLPRHAFVVEVGCGTGGTLLRLARARPDIRIVGVDHAEAMVHEAKQRFLSPLGRVHACQVDVLTGSAEELPVEAKVADAVLFVWTLHGLKHPAEALREGVRVLQPGGSIYVLETTLAQGQESLVAQIEQVVPEGLRHWLPARRRVRSLGQMSQGFSAQALIRAAGLTGVAKQPLLGGAITLYYGKKREK